MASKRRPEIRLLFDELLSPRVARALRELGFRVSYVGNNDDGAPPRGSSDEEVLAFADKTNQLVATSNHDLILLACELGVSVLWVDPRGRQFTSDQLALLFFRRIAEWQRVLKEEPKPVVVRALRTKTEVLQLDRAAHLAQQRMRRIKQRERARKPKPLGPLMDE